MSDELFEAIKNGDRDRVIALVAEHPAVAASERDGVTAVLLAAYYRQTDLALLLARAKSSLSVHEAAALGDVARLRAHLKQDRSAVNVVAPDGFQPLGLAAFFGHPEAVNVLLEHGAALDTPSANGMGVTPLQSAIAANHSEIARALIEAGANVNVKQQHGWTALHAAAEHGNAEIVALLLARGADPTARNDVGTSAIELARTSHHEAVARLIEAAVLH